MKTTTILIDAGHGSNTPGKRSPLLPNGGRLCEWVYTRTLAMRIANRAQEVGVKVVHIVTEERDIPLTERYKRANQYIKKHPAEQCVLFSIHGNAAGNGETWCSARGFEAWTTVGRNNSDRLAELVCNEVAALLPAVRIRTDKTDGDQDKEKNWTVIAGANCPAVLTENLFYDNREDVALMQDKETQEALAMAHVNAVQKYFGI